MRISPTRKKQIIYPFIVLAVGVVAFVGLKALKRPPEEKVRNEVAPLVSTEGVEVGPLQLRVDSQGVVKTKYQTQLVAQVSGEIVFLAEEFVRGGMVKAGQLLARIDPSDYEALLVEAEANLVSARAALALERAQGKVAAYEWRELSSGTPTELSLRKPQLAQEMARVKAAEAALKRAERNLERTSISAPYDALIESREVGMGSFVNTGSAVGGLYNVSVAEVRLPVADHQLRFLERQGVGASAMLEADYAGKRMQWPATVVRSEGVVDNTSRMTYLVAEVKDPYGFGAGLSESAETLSKGTSPLRFGTYVTARIQGTTLASAAMVPAHLVVNNQVAIVGNDQTLRLREVEVVRREGANVVISDGLYNGEQLITSAIELPLEGMKLRLADKSGNVTEPKPELAAERSKAASRENQKESELL